MRELSIFCDESGGQNGHSKYCLLSLVLHNQSMPLERYIEDYKRALASVGLPDISFHASPLMYGKGPYEHMDLSERKRLFMHFTVFQNTIDYELSKEAIVYREAHPQDYCLFQIADYICTMELIAMKFSNKETTATDEKFFGTSERAFKRNYLKQLRRKLMA